MAIEQRIRSWEDLFAARARAEVGDGIAGVMALANATDLISFSGGFPDPATFPGPELARILGEIIESGDASAFQYGPTQGLPGLRDYLRQRLARLEGVEPGEAELLVTSGGIEALELIGKSFLDPGDTVAVEAPSYMGALMAFRSFEARLAGVPMDEQGLAVERFEDVARLERPKLLYTIPDHQNPAGVSLSAERRTALVEAARRTGTLLVEDVAYRELGFADERLPSLWSLAPDSVVQIGTFSKTFFPGARLGWAVGPPEVIARLTAAKQLTDQCAGTLGQRLLEESGRRGLLDAGILRARELYARRCALLLDALQRHLRPDATWTRPHGGFFSWLTLPETVDAAALSTRAREAGVAFVPGTLFFPDGRGHNAARLSFSKVADDLVEEGVRRLAVLFS